MLTRIARILMNEADASPGGGAPVSTPAAPEGQAQAPSLDSLVEKLTGVIDQRLEGMKNSVEANTRRMIEGALGKKKGEPAKADPPTPAASSAPVSSPDSKKWATFNRKAGALGMSENAIARLERAFEMENPDDVAGWFDGYVADLGIKAPSEKAAATPSAPAPATATPAASATPAAPAPSTAVSGDGPDSVRKWDESTLRAYLGKNGGNAANPMAWSNRKQSIELAQRLANELAGHRIVSSKK